MPPSLQQTHEIRSCKNEIKSFLFINKTAYNVLIAFTALTILSLTLGIEAHSHEQKREH